LESIDAMGKPSASATGRSWRLRGYLRLIHPFPVAMNAIAAVSFAMLAVHGWPGLRAASLIAAAIIGSQATVGVVNDLRDRDLDAIAKPEKPLVSGRVTVRGAACVGILTLAVAITTGLALGPLSLLFVLAMTAAGLIYDLWLKRTAVSFLPYIFGLPLLPIWAWTSVRDAPPRLWLTYPLGVLVGFGLHLANALPDAERDAAGGIRGIVQIVGVRGALILCLGSFALTVLIVSVLTAARRDAAVFVLIGGAAVLLGGAALSAAVRPTTDTLQRNWGVLIGCAIGIAAAWLRALS
jgi:4-hydroxybenzoate polyprenyltransferase